MIGTINCVYETPCGWCSKWDKKCDNKIPERGQRAKCNPVDDVIDDIGESIKFVYDDWYGNDDIAEKLISNGVTVQEWISVKDRLPDNKEYDWVLAQVVENNGFMHIPTVMEYRQSKNDWFEETYGWLSEHNGLFTVTHWMPLPEPPKGE